MHKCFLNSTTKTSPFQGIRFCLIQTIENPPFHFRKNSYTIFKIIAEGDHSYSVLYKHYTHSEDAVGPFAGYINKKEFKAGVETGKIKVLTEDLHAKILLEQS